MRVDSNACGWCCIPPRRGQGTQLGSSERAEQSFRDGGNKYAWPGGNGKTHGPQSTVLGCSSSAANRHGRTELHSLSNPPRLHHPTSPQPCVALPPSLRRHRGAAVALFQARFCCQGGSRCHLTVPNTNKSASNTDTNVVTRATSVNDFRFFLAYC